MAWNESFCVGHDLVDTQHQTFFRMVAKAGETAGRGSAREIVGHLNFLAAYTAMHFQDEERLMEACGFPGRDEHRAVHQAFVARVATLLKAHAADPAAANAQQILPLMSEWLVVHILGMDKQFQPWVERMKRG
jgi:hemerythrin-like metal-binding protein